jgi:hypothetical protein
MARHSVKNGYQRATLGPSDLLRHTSGEYLIKPRNEQVVGSIPTGGSVCLANQPVRRCAYPLLQTRIDALGV